MNEDTNINLGDCISDVTGRQVGMRLDEYVYIDTKEKVEDENMELALKLRQEKLDANDFSNKLREANNYLLETSWIWEKYARNVQLLKDITEDEFRTKYADIITKQEVARKFIRDNEVK